MRALLAASALLAFAGCTEKTPSDAPPPKPKAQAKAPEGPAGDVVLGLEQAVERCKKAEAKPHEIQRCTAFRRFAGRLRSKVGAYSPDMPTSIEPFKARIQVGFDRLAHEDPWMRAGALAVVEQGLIAAQYKPSDHTKGWVDQVAERVGQATDVDEQISLLRLLGNHAGADQQAALEKLGQTAKASGVRAGAWAALARCTASGCKPDAAMIEATWAKETEMRAKAGLALLAGWTQHPKTVTWCTPLLDDALAGPGCRAALKRQGDVPAFQALLARADRLAAAATPAGDEAKDGEAASALADLTALARLPEASPAVYDRFDAFLKAGRHAQARMRVSGQLLFVPDKARAKAIAEAELGRVKDDPKMTLVANRLRRVLSSLSEGHKHKGARAGRGHGGHDHGGHGHAHGDHGHAHGAQKGHGHDHGAQKKGHDHQGHDHGAQKKGHGHDHGAQKKGHGHDHGDHGHAH